jgi:preprotein translocase subunit SecA
MRVFGGDRLAGMMDRLRVDEDTPIENRFVSKSLESAQKRVEGFNFDARKNVVQYDDVMNRHRTATYAMRKKLLQDIDVSSRIKDFIKDEATALAALPGNDDEYETLIKDVFPFDDAVLDRLFNAEADKFGKVLITEANELYANRELVFTTPIMREVERDVYFQILDNLWMQHLESMDHLRKGIHWYGVGQKDPLVEYRRQSQVMYDQMLITLRHEVVRLLYRAEPISQDKLNAPVETELTRAARSAVDNADKITEEEVLRESDFKKAANAKSKNQIKRKTRKAERKRRSKGRRR